MCIRDRGILSDAKTVKVQSGEDEEVMVSITDNQLDIYKESVLSLIHIWTLPGTYKYKSTLFAFTRRGGDA